MRWKLTWFFVFAVLVLACTGQRNIDYEDRKERLGQETSSGDNDNGSSEGPVAKLSFLGSNLMQINDKTLSVSLEGLVGPFSSGSEIEYSFLIDLESDEIYTLDPAADPFTVGSIQCLRKGALLCEKFSFKSSIAAFEKMGRFPTQPPANVEGTFELQFEALDSKFGLFQAGPQTLLETYPVASVEFTTFDNSKSKLYYMLGPYDPLASSRYFQLKSENKWFKYRFRCPTRSSAWSLVKDRRTNLNSSMFLSCSYLKNDDKTTAVESFSLEHVQN